MAPQVLYIDNNGHANTMIGLFNILSMINKEVRPDGLGYSLEYVSHFC